MVVVVVVEVVVVVVIEVVVIIIIVVVVVVVVVVSLHQDSFSKQFVNNDGRMVGKQKSVTYLGFDEESMATKKGKVQGVLNLVHRLHTFTAPGVMPGPVAGQGESKERKHFQGTSMRGNMIQGISLPDWESTWMVSKQKKAAILGGVGSVQVGGSPDPVTEVGEKPSFDHDLIPVCWHGLPPELYEEFFFSFGLKSCVLATTMDENGCLAAIFSKVPVVAVCFCEDHIQALRQRLEEKVWAAMADPNSDIYDAEFAKIVGSETKASGGTRQKKSRGNTTSNKGPKAKKQKKKESSADEAQDDAADDADEASGVMHIPNPFSPHAFFHHQAGCGI